MVLSFPPQVGSRRYSDHVRRDRGGRRPWTGKEEERKIQQINVPFLSLRLFSCNFVRDHISKAPEK